MLELIPKGRGEETPLSRQRVSMWDAWVHLSLIRPPGKTLLHIPAPRESSFPAARTRSHARGGGAGEREGAWGGGREAVGHT